MTSPKSQSHRTPAQRRAANRLGARNPEQPPRNPTAHEQRAVTPTRQATPARAAILPDTLPPLAVTGPLAKPDALPTIALLGPGQALVDALARFDGPARVLAALVPVQ